MNNNSAKRNHSCPNDITPANSAQKDLKTIEGGGDFGFAKSMTPGSRSIPGPGGVFHKRAQPQALYKQLPAPPPSFPSHYPHLFPSSGNCLSKNIAAPAAKSLSPIIMPQAKPEFAGGEVAYASSVTANIQESVAAQPFPGDLGITRNLSPTTPTTTSNQNTPEAIGADGHRRRVWDLFFRGIKRGRSEYSRIRHHNPHDSRLKILGHCCFACRMSAGFRLDENGERSVSIGYAKDGLSFMGTTKCGAGRFCILCGAAIAVKNQKDIEQGLHNAIEKGWFSIMLTYTIPHQLPQSAMELVEKLTLARKYAEKGGDLSRFRKKMDI